MCCSVSQCVAVCALNFCTNIECLAQRLSSSRCSTLEHTAAYRSTLQHTATHCNTLQHTATHCNTLQHTAASCPTGVATETLCVARHHNTPNHTATSTTAKSHYSPGTAAETPQAATTLKHTVIKCIKLFHTHTAHLAQPKKFLALHHTATHCVTLLLQNTHCNTWHSL